MANHADKLNNDLFGDSKEEDKPIFTEEEQFLNERGFDLFIARGWYKQHEESILTTKGTIRTSFFEWYLKSCEQKELEMLKRDLLSEPILKRLNDANPIEITIKADKNSLIFSSSDNENLKEHYEELYEKYKGLLSGLYEIMVNKMEFRVKMILCDKCGEGNSFSIQEDSIKQDAITTDDEHLIIKIEEALGK